MRAHHSRRAASDRNPSFGRRVFVLGPVPPPLGGVSVHVIRYAALLRENGYRASVHSYTGIAATRPLRRMAQVAGMFMRIYRDVRPDEKDVLHVHYGGAAYLLALTPLLRSTRARKVITFHSVRVVQDMRAASGWRRRWLTSLLGGFQAFVPVRSEIQDHLDELGIHAPETIVMPAYLPPASEETAIDRLPEDLGSALQSAQQQGRCQLCVAAYQLGPGYGHEDVYGLQALLDCLAARDAATETESDLWILVSNRPSTSDQRSAEAEILERAASLRRIRVRLLYGMPLVPLLARCDAFLRPSREDGDSVAIREALSLGVPVLASDVVRRPAGVEVFSMRDREGMEEALKGFLERICSSSAAMDRVDADEPDDRYRRFVRRVVEGGSGSGSRQPRTKRPEHPRLGPT